MSKKLLYLLSGFLVLAAVVFGVTNLSGSHQPQKNDIDLSQVVPGLGAQKVEALARSISDQYYAAVSNPIQPCTVFAPPLLEPYSYAMSPDQMLGSSAGTVGHAGLPAACNETQSVSQFNPTFVKSLPTQNWCQRPNSDWNKVAQPLIIYQCDESSTQVYRHYDAQNLCSASIQVGFDPQLNRQTFYYLCSNPTQPGASLTIKR